MASKFRSIIYAAEHLLEGVQHRTVYIQSLGDITHLFEAISFIFTHYVAVISELLTD